MLKRSLSAAIVAMALLGGAWALSPSSASAAPMPAAPLASEDVTPTQVEQAYWVRRCWRGYYGRLHCRAVWRGGYYHRPYWRRHCWRGYYGRLHCRRY
jgi:hypothetical protein